MERRRHTPRGRAFTRRAFCTTSLAQGVDLGQTVQANLVQIAISEHKECNRVQPNHQLRTILNIENAIIFWHYVVIFLLLRLS